MKRLFAPAALAGVFLLLAALFLASGTGTLPVATATVISPAIQPPVIQPSVVAPVVAPTVDVIPSPTPQPTPIPITMASYDGRWIGTTAQGQPITITVFDGAIRWVETSVEVAGQGWTATLPPGPHPFSATITSDSGFEGLNETRSRGIRITGALRQTRAYMAGLIAAVHIHPEGMGEGRARVWFEAHHEAYPAPVGYVDPRLEPYRWAISLGPTGIALNGLLGRRMIDVELGTPECPVTLDCTAISDVGIIVLPSDRFAPPDAQTLTRIQAAVRGEIPLGEVADQVNRLMSEAAVLAHELAHHLYGDPTLGSAPGSEHRQFAEWRARVVEVKVVAEMRAAILGRPVDYYDPAIWEVYESSLPPDVTDTEALMLGAAPMEPDLALELLSFPIK